MQNASYGGANRARRRIGASLGIGSWPRLKRRLTAATVGASLALGLNCDDSNLQAFRDAAAPTVEAGVTSVVTGLISGVFATLTDDGETSEAPTADPGA